MFGKMKLSPLGALAALVVCMGVLEVASPKQAIATLPLPSQTCPSQYAAWRLCVQNVLAQPLGGTTPNSATTCFSQCGAIYGVPVPNNGGNPLIDPRITPAPGRPPYPTPNANPIQGAIPFQNCFNTCLHNASDVVCKPQYQNYMDCLNNPTPSQSLHGTPY